MGAAVNALTAIFTEYQKYLLTLEGGLTALMIVVNAIRYQGGSEDEKTHYSKQIKKIALMGGGIFVILAVVGEVITKLQGIAA